VSDRENGGQWATYALLTVQAVLLGLVGYGAVTGTFGLAAMGLVGLGATLVPRALARRYDHEVDSRLAVWIGLAVLGHVVGFLGLYEIHSGPLRFYDQVAHVISASLVAGLGYAIIEAVDESSTHINFPEDFREVFTVVVILAVGVTWEIIEFSVGGATMALTGEEALVQYGLRDTIYDLTANTLAATALATWGTGYFDDVAAILSLGVFGTERS